MNKDKEYIAEIDKIVSEYQARAQSGIPEDDIYEAHSDLIRRLAAAKINIYGMKLGEALSHDIAHKICDIMKEEFSVNDLNLFFSLEPSENHPERSYVVVTGPGLTNPHKNMEHHRESMRWTYTSMVKLADRL